MEKVCKCLEKLDVVKALQFAAVAIYLAVLVQLVLQLVQANNVTFLNGLLVSGLQLVHGLYQPVILLGLAELVKLMRKRNDQN